MGKYQEVEMKFPLFNIEAVLQQIEKLGFKKILDDEVQNDSYYTPFHKNFLEFEIVSEWLRLRETKNKCTLNFKQWLPVGAKVQNQCNEYETIIEDVYAAKKIFDLLDFREIIVVNKTRNSWIYENVEVSIDYVDTLGTFIELEATDKVSEDEIAGVHKHFNKILTQLKAEIGERDCRGYPYLVLEKNNKIE